MREPVEKRSKAELLAVYSAACDYPGRLDEAQVEAHLKRYLKILSIDKKVERIRQGWDVHESPSLFRYANAVLDDSHFTKPQVLVAGK